MNAPTPPPPKTSPFLAFAEMLHALLKQWLLLLARLYGGFGVRRNGAPRRWHLSVATVAQPTKKNAADADRFLKRHRDLNDIEKLASVAARFRTPESDFFADPNQIERLMQHLLEENPPWLYLSRVLAGGEQGAESHSPEFLYREQTTREIDDVTLFIPEEGWHDQPLASLTMRPTRTLDEVWHARLLDQILPPEILVDRHSRGEIMVPVRQGVRKRIEFRTETRRMDVTTRKPVPIPIEMEGGSGSGGQLLYFLLDFSASMHGKSATLALAVIAATLRANMGQRETRYLFRRYADSAEMWPRIVEPPLQARTLAEKDALLDVIFSTNFNGGATHVNDALNVAVSDIESLRREEHLEAGMLLVTDGRAEILESTHLRLRAAGVKVHTVMVVPERNPGLERISESFTALDIQPDVPLGNIKPPDAAPEDESLPSYHI